MAFLYGEKVVRRMILAGDFSFEESLRSTMAVLAGAVVCDLKKMLADDQRYIKVRMIAYLGLLVGS